MEPKMTMSMVLIAHDDSILVAELSQILREGGVERVLTARNKHQVVSAVREHGHEIDLIVHDVLMDEMDGFQLLPLLKRSFFEGRLLFTSVDGSLAIMASIVASENGVDVIGVIPAQQRLIRHADIWRVPVGFRINRHRFDPQFLTGPDYSECDFTPVGYQNSLEHAFRLLYLDLCIAG